MMLKSIMRFIKGDYPDVKNTIQSKPKEDITIVDGVIINCTAHTIGFNKQISIVNVYCILRDLFDDMEFMCEQVPMERSAPHCFYMVSPWKLCNHTKYMIEDIGLIKPVKVRMI